MWDRLLGLETEYVLRFTPAGGPPPGRSEIYRAWMIAVGRVVRTRPAGRGFGHDRCFTENGGAFCYEALPWAFEAGLLEGATPECRGPGQVLLYQRAQEALLLTTRRAAETELARRGHPGRLALVKNARDAEGHVYGPQENYEATLARGPALLVWRGVVTALAPLVAVGALLTWGLSLGLLAAVALISLGRLLGRWILGRGLGPGDPAALPAWFGRSVLWIQQACLGPAVLAFAAAARALAFRRQRRALTAFLISRPVVTGAGTLTDQGLFGLSEKGPAMRRVLRWSVLPADRCIYDVGNLMKDLLAPLVPALRPYGRLYRARQRLQLGLSDANLAQTAEYLKVGTTALLLDLAEAGALDDAPRVRRPVPALHRLAGDPDLTTRVACTDGLERTALELQGWYQARARAWLAAQPAADLEALTVTRLWGEVLEALARDPQALVGRLDWVTKRWLLAEAADLPAAARKKIDLRYHELGEGYLQRLEEAGRAPVLVDPREVLAAIRHPPLDTPAYLRGRAVAARGLSSDPMAVGWDQVRIGEGPGAKIIRLAGRRGAPGGAGR